MVRQLKIMMDNLFHTRYQSFQQMQDTVAPWFSTLLVLFPTTFEMHFFTSILFFTDAIERV